MGIAIGRHIDPRIRASGIFDNNMIKNTVSGQSRQMYISPISRSRTGRIAVPIGVAAITVIGRGCKNYGLILCAIRVQSAIDL